METLRDIVQRLDELDDDGTIYTDGRSPAARAVVVTDAPSAASARAAGLRSFLEVPLAKDVVLVWSEWRGSAQPSLDDRLLAVSYYATHDAYLPLD